jgi:hypothetical protein
MATEASVCTVDRQAATAVARPGARGLAARVQPLRSLGCPDVPGDRAVAVPRGRVVCRDLPADRVQVPGGTVLERGGDAPVMAAPLLQIPREAFERVGVCEQ